jgi:uncharacterized protein YbbC (DUF1343 family)
MRHGLTIGELAIMFNNHFSIGCELSVIPMKGWKRKMFYNETGLPWVPPSPNLPTPASAILYPGQVILEGTNISEGRGTAQPFEIFGAPYIDTGKIIASLGGCKLPGAVLRPLVFEPTSGKWAKEPCRGFQIHLTDPYAYKPYLSALKLLHAVFFNHTDEFKWKTPPYEYEFEKLPVDLITGNPLIRNAIEKAEKIDEIEKFWRSGLEDYIDIIRKYYLYD